MRAWTMRKGMAAGCAAMVLGLAGWADAAAGDGPTPFPDAKDEAAWPGKGPIRVFDWMNHNRAHFWNQREKDQGAVVFVGDSLTQGWDKNGFKDVLPGHKVANRGIGGDGSRNVVFRLKEDVLDLNPKAVVLNIGSNDLSAHANPADIESNIDNILQQIRDKDPKLPVVLCTIPPRDNPKAPTKPGAQADTNARIAKLAEKYDNVTLLDLFAPLADEKGMPVAENFAEDKLHFARPGYDKWAELVRPILEKALAE